VIHRVILHVDGPPGAGKTSLVEALLRSMDADVICMRGMHDESRRTPKEERPRAHPELRRYRSAGASGVTLYRFREVDSDAFYDSDFMTDYSEAVMIEGVCPLEWVDLIAFVVRPSSSRTSLLRQVKRDHKAEHERSLAELERALSTPESMARFFVGAFGGRAVELALKHPEKWQPIRDQASAELARLRSASPPAPTEHWAVAPAYRGIERAHVVLVNVHGEAERRRGEQLVEEVKRLRTDEAVFHDVLGPLGHRIPITVLAADLSDPRDPGLRKALTRIKRTLRRPD